MLEQIRASHVSVETGMQINDGAWTPIEMSNKIIRLCDRYDRLYLSPICAPESPH